MSSRVVIPALPKALWPAAPWLAAAAIALAGTVMQSHTYLNHDIAWILHTARALLDGAVFGKDFLPSNPPLIWYLSLPVVALAQVSGLHVADLFRASVVVLTWAALAVAYLLLRRPEFALQGRTLALVALMGAYCFFIGSQRDFGQREYLAVALSLPYLMLVALRLAGGAFDPRLAVLIGLSAGIGLALKPYFLAVPALVELFVLWRSRSLRQVFRAESWALGLFVALYAGSLPFLVPEYLWDLIPRMSRIYWGFQNPASVVLMPIAPAALGFLLALYLAVRQSKPILPLILLIAGAGFLLSYLVQFKGYSYHAFPLQAILGLLLTLQISEIWALEEDGPHRGVKLRRVLAAAFLLLFMAGNLSAALQWYDRANRSDGRFAAQTADLTALVDRWAGNGPYLAISTHPYPAFPIAIYSTAKWASRTHSTFFLPAVAKLRNGSGAGDAADLKFAEDNAQSLMLEDLARRPRIVLVSAQAWKHGLGELPFGLLDFYLENPAIRRAWGDYREIEGLAGYRVFVRRGIEGAS